MERIIGITGGIGSGKSTVSAYIRQLGGAVLSADEINAEILLQPEVVEEIGQVFPYVVEDGAVNKKALGAIVFNNEKEKQKLLDITRPLIIDSFFDKLDSLSKKNKLVFAEVPLLFEWNLADAFDEVWVITANKESRLARIMQRDGVSAQYAEAVMENQYSGRHHTHNSVLIENDGNQQQLTAAVEQQLRRLKFVKKA